MAYIDIPCTPLGNEQVMAYIDIPCTPLGSTASGYCGDEHVKWMSDTRLALSNQGVNAEAFAHVICKWGHTNECDIIPLLIADTLQAHVPPPRQFKCELLKGFLLLFPQMTCLSCLVHGQACLPSRDLMS